MATLHIEIPDQRAEALKAHAQAQGLTVEKWLERLVEQAAPSTPEPAVVELQANRPIWETFADAMKDVPREDWASLPKDGAAQIDHYLYGHPKT